MLITFLPMNRKIEVDYGANLMQVAKENNIDLGGTCAGNKTCGKCKALITKGNHKVFSKEEIGFLTEEETMAGIRLTCCFTVTQDTTVILTGRQPDRVQVTSKLYQKSAVAAYGVAFDIGTTTVEAELWDLDNKFMLGRQSAPNPQRLYGADVISRITYANTSLDNQNRLTELIRNCCNQLIDMLAEQAEIENDHIKSVVIAANTTMSHLFLGKSLESLAKVPFQGISYAGEEKIASDISIHIYPEGTVYVMPGIGGHVGSDTLGCILAKDLAHAKGPKLMMDIGTNGEIVLAKNGELIACSTAAGPAFEGSSLHQGMRAEYGAIAKVDIIDDKIIVDVIGDEKDGMKPVPIGICGSGVIEAISELYKSGQMDSTGRLLGKAGDDNFVLLYLGKTMKDQVILTQKDIREIQLAKGAIYAGMQILLREEKMKPAELDTLYLAGTFGNYINMKKGIHIGLLPAMELDKIEYIGNGALTGAAKILLGEVSKEEAERISKNTRHLELALREDFQEEFLKAISFPEKE